MKLYYIGFVKDGKTLVIQAKETVDQLSCETWKYWGQREITKGELKEKARQLLACVNDLYHKSFKHVRVE